MIPTRFSLLLPLFFIGCSDPLETFPPLKPSAPKDVPTGVHISNLDEHEGITYLRTLEGRSVEPYSGKIYARHTNGQLGEKGAYLEGKKHGPFERYYENGQIEKKENYSGGMRHGAFQMYYPNGQLWKSAAYQDDKQNGPYESYYSNGQTEERASYANGMLHGPYESHHENGKVKETADYQNGEKHGTFTRYYDCLLYTSPSPRD